MRVKELFKELAPDYSPSNDPFGTVMITWFRVADEMYRRGIKIPKNWDYRPGAGVLGERDLEFEHLTNSELKTLGNFLERLVKRLIKAGRDY